MTDKRNTSTSTAGTKATTFTIECGTPVPLKSVHRRIIDCKQLESIAQSISGAGRIIAEAIFVGLLLHGCMGGFR